MISADLAELSRIRTHMEDVGRASGLSDARIFDLQVATSEAVANAIEHASSEVELVVWTLPDRLMVEITNEGVFQPGLYKDDASRRRGLGLPLMVSLADQVHVSSPSQGQTQVTLTFFLEARGRPDPLRANDRDRLAPGATGRAVAPGAGEGEDRYRNLVNLSPDAILVEVDGTCVFANPAAAKLFGARSPGDLLDADVMQRVHAGDREMVARRMGQVISGAVSPPRDIRFIRPDGSSVTGEVTGSRVEFGGILAVQVLIRDVTERRQAEQALLQSEQAAREAEVRYRDLFNTLTEGFCVIEVVFDDTDTPVDYRFLETNPRFEEQTGLHGVQGKLMRELAPDNDEYWYEIYGRVAVTGESVRFQAPSTPLGRSYDVSAFRVGGEESRQVGILFNDITAAKQAAEALREGEARFHVMADAIPQLAWMANADGFIYWYNQRWYEYTGTTFAQMEGWGWQSVHDPEALPWVMTRWQDSIATGQPFDMEFPLRGADGEFRPFLTRVMPLRDAAGRVTQWFGTNTDISERKRTEEAIRDSEDRVRFALEVSRTGAWDLDLSDHSAHRSLEHDRIFGYESLLPHWTYEIFLDHVVAADRELVDQKFQAAIATRGDWSFECRIRRADGEIRWIWAAGRHRSRDDGGWRIAGIIQDITERVQAKERLLALNRTLKARSDSDQALIRAADESSYLREVCRIIVEDCGHALVWIGYKQDDEAKRILPIVSAGFEEHYLETLEITWADNERGRGPTGTAVRTGRPAGCRHMLTDPAFAPWREEALKRGYASSIALPLVANGESFGAVTIYSRYTDPFSPDEVDLLGQLADDLSLGITTLRMRVAHAEAEMERERLLAEAQALSEELAATNQELQEQAEELAAVNEELRAQTEELHAQTVELALREDRLRAQNEELRASRYNRSLIEASLDPLVTIGLDGKITDVNAAAVTITGYDRGELIGTDFADYFADTRSARDSYREVIANGAITDYPLTVRSRNGKLTDVLYNAALYRDEEGEVLGVFAAARDITALRELEQQRAIAGKLQEALLDIPDEVPGAQLSHLYRSATERALVGGDFYDVFQTKHKGIGILIGDVSGHGVEAARIAILVKDTVHAFAHQFGRPRLVLRATNRLLVQRGIPGFVTAFLGFLDPETGAFVYSCAGHPPPFLARGGQISFLECIAPPLGVFANARFDDVEANIPVGSRLLFYTDGITEARRDGDFFGEKRLADILAQTRGVRLADVPSLLLEEALLFAQGSLLDDVALLAIDYIGLEDGQKPR